MMDNINDALANLTPEQRQLIELMLHQSEEPTLPPSNTITHQENIGPAPLSFAQQRLWFLEQLEPGSAAYNLPMAMRMEGNLNVKALEQSLNEVVARHEVLRTIFVAEEGNPTQVVIPSLKIDIPLVDFSATSKTEQSARVQQLVLQEAGIPFNLKHGPMLRATLLRLSANEHVLLLTMHHSVSDGWSISVLTREMALLYHAFSTGKPSLLPALTTQYKDYAIWQRKWLTGEVLAQQLAYWKQQLNGNLPPLELPTDHPRPLVQTFQGAIAKFHIPKELTDRLKAISQQHSATLFMVLLAGFQILLYRYTHQHDFIVGTPIANRNRVEIENLIGFFVNTLALRADLSGNPTFVELLQRVRKVTLGAYGHQDLPFERLIEELQLKRDISRSPLFQVMLVLQNMPMPAMEAAGLKLTWLDLTNSGTAKFDLTMTLTEMPDGLRGALEYRTHLFEPATIARLLTHFQNLLEGIAANPQRHLSELPMLTGEERHQLVEAWNATHTAYDNQRPIHQWIESQVERSPNAIAIQFQQEQITYRTLNERANQFAHYLRTLGVGPETLVGIHMKRSIEMVVALLGILKAGGAYVPLDPTYPKERLAFILADSQVSVLLTETALQENLPEHKAQTIYLDQTWPSINTLEKTNLPHRGSPTQLTYIIYTSGSTGKPKGVQIVQSGLINFLLAMQHQFKLTEADRLLSVTTLSFDIAGLELYLPLMAGAQIEIVPREVAADGFQLRKYLQSSGATIMQATPATWQMLLEAGWNESERVKILCGGEALTPALASALLPRSTELWNMYGPTEITVWATLAQIQTADGIAPIGHPIANTQLYVVDEYLNPVPVGAAGELYIGGDGLARGYLNRPALTAERFIPDPFSQKTGARLYRTGDMVRWLPSGNLEYIGRVDFQVKIRGHRIELGEIESVLTLQAGIHQAVVTVHEDSSGEKHLVAYIVCHPNTELTVNQLRTSLKTKLPEYMLPASFIFLSQMPLTPNGKIDRKALPAPSQDQHEKAEYIAPRSPAEETIAQIWTDVIGIKQIGIHDNFFELGGDSLQVMRVIAKADVAGLRFTPQDFFQHQTIAELSTIWQISTSTTAEQPIIETGPVPPMPLIMYNYTSHDTQPWWRALVAIIELPRTITPLQLNDVVQLLITHHDNLRLRLIKENGDAHLLIVDADDQAFIERDLSALSAEEQEAAIESSVDEQWACLNFSTGPLFRIVFFNLEPERLPRILIIVHHFAADGYSTGILMNDFQSLCQQIIMQEPLKLPTKSTSIKQWAERMYNYIHSDAAQVDIDYWKSRPWAEIRPTPVDHPEVTHSTFARWSEFLTAEETQILFKKVPAAYNVELLDVLLTACITSYAQSTPLKLFALALLYHGRSLAMDGINLHRTVGNFYIPYPLFFDMDQIRAMKDNPEQTLALVAKTRAQVPNDGATWPWVSYYTDRESAPWEKKLSNAIFNYLGQTTLETQNQAGLFRNLYKPAEAPADRLYSVQDAAPHTCSTIVEAGRFKVNWEYYPALDDASTIEQLVQNLLSMLRTFIKKVE